MQMMCSQRLVLLVFGLSLKPQYYFMFPYEDEYLRADRLVFMPKISAHCLSICCGFEPIVSKVLQTDFPITRVRVSQTKVTVSNVLSSVVSSDLQPHSLNATGLAQNMIINLFYYYDDDVSCLTGTFPANKNMFPFEWE